MKKILSITFLLMIILLNSVVYALTLNLDITSNKEKVDVDEEIVVTVDWKEEMQAADFILNYDSSKFEFVNIDIENDFYTIKDNAIEIVWFSLDETDKTSISVTFKALNPGKAKFSTEIDGGFATGELVIPDNYNTNSTTVKVNGFTTGNIILGVVAVIVLILIGVFILKRTKRK